MPIVLWVALGGAIGASGRYLVGVWASRLLSHGFPYGTLCVNVLGCFLMGAIVEAAALKFSMGQDMRAFLTTGVLGGFTTFSAFALDFAVLTERKAHLMAWGYVGASVGISIMALFAGIWLVRLVLQ